MVIQLLGNRLVPLYQYICNFSKLGGCCMASITCSSFLSCPSSSPKSRCNLRRLFLLSSRAFSASLASFTFPKRFIERFLRLISFPKSSRVDTSSLTLSSLHTTKESRVRRQLNLPIPLGMKSTLVVPRHSRYLKLIRFPNPRGSLLRL
ncbi:hypothetical protein CFOL_v3_32528 [Cephalotus follicularis]|uniref:Uncharacterized protein n=1 Tax=Cephalotus follicularis TaxID=3775 RepID=A0A1Q3DA16_CEPFO|nr:hypothetical protein CFOL_v3_32528 [Cephalotus follicularis]